MSALNANHLRSLRSTLLIVEQMLNEMDEAMNRNNKDCCHELLRDLDEEKQLANRILIREAKQQICQMAEKYQTGKTTQSLQMIVNVKKTRIWEVLCDSKSKRLKGFGEFPKSLAADFDKDIDGLLAITEKIQI